MQGKKQKFGLSVESWIPRIGCFAKKSKRWKKSERWATRAVMKNSGVYFVDKGEERVVYLAQS